VTSGCRTAFARGDTKRLHRDASRLDPPPQFFIDQSDQGNLPLASHRVRYRFERTCFPSFQGY